MEKISWLLVLEAAIPLALKDTEFQSPSVWTTEFEPTAHFSEGNKYSTMEKGSSHLSFLSFSPPIQEFVKLGEEEIDKTTLIIVMIKTLGSACSTVHGFYMCPEF